MQRVARELPRNIVLASLDKQISMPQIKKKKSKFIEVKINKGVRVPSVYCSTVPRFILYLAVVTLKKFLNSLDTEHESTH